LAGTFCSARCLTKMIIPTSRARIPITVLLVGQ
jgi:hypothetical protein